MNGRQRTAGVIGLGMMGGGIARHALAAGFTIHGFDIAEPALAGFEEVGGIRANSAAEVVERADIVVTSLLTAASLRSVTTEIEPSLTESHVLVETSTFPLSDKAWMANVVSETGATPLDCTLSGTGAQMRDRDIAVYASGDTAALGRCQPLFETFARAVYLLGDFGNGSKMKFIANHLVVVHNLAAAEALLLARGAGLDLDQVLRAVTDGAGTSRMLEVRGPKMTAGDFADASFPLAGLQKDIDTIAAFAHDLHVPLPLFATAGPIYQAGLAQHRESMDPAVVFAVLEQLSRPCAGPTAQP